jgi:glycosyltransferase involved in cell wall biosynthesis
MGKFSIVIPTLWKSNRTKKLLSDLNECEYVDEIIVINNQLTDVLDAKIEKVRHVSFGGNIYVNPAWNKGIELARNNQIALLNDDINFNPNIFEVITEDVLNQFGIIGMGEGNYKSLNIEGDPILEVWQPGVNDWGWGCFIMLNKKDWIDIPDDIKIWYGDNIIKDVNPSPKAVLRNFRVDTEMSTTSDEPIWDERKKEDYDNFIKYLRNEKVTN